MDFGGQELASKDSFFWYNAEMWRQFAQYEQDFKKVIKQREMKRIPFHHQSPQILFRNELIAYLKQTATQKKLSHSCLHLAVYLLDIFMDNHDIVPHYLLLICNVCLLIAAKFEECAQKIPKIADMNALVKNRYTNKEHKSVEVLILNFFLGYVMFPTAAHYTYYYMKALISPEDTQYFTGNSRELLCELNESIKTYLEYTIDDIHFMQLYPPSQLAASILGAARAKLGLPCWTPVLENLTEYKLEQLQHSLADILKGQTSRCIHCEELKSA